LPEIRERERKKIENFLFQYLLYFFSISEKPGNEMKTNNNFLFENELTANGEREREERERERKEGVSLSKWLWS